MADQNRPAVPERVSPLNEPVVPEQYKADRTAPVEAPAAPEQMTVLPDEPDGPTLASGTAAVVLGAGAGALAGALLGPVGAVVGAVAGGALASTMGDDDQPR